MPVAKKLSEEALKVLGKLEVSTFEPVGKEVAVTMAKITAGQLDRKIYLEVNAALEAAGGTWNRKNKAHLFPGANVEEKLSAIFAAGEVIDPKKLFQFYETPSALANRVVELTKIEDGHDVLEPSAGHGALVTAVLNHHAAKVTAVELDKEKVAILNDINALSPEGEKELFVLHADFLSWVATTTQRFDRIVMNPPFSKQQDAHHVKAAFTLLKPGGRLVAIMSAAVRFRETEAYRWVRNNATKIIDNPEGSFVSSGTNVNTCIVIMEKP